MSTYLVAFIISDFKSISKMTKSGVKVSPGIVRLSHRVTKLSLPAWDCLGFKTGSPTLLNLGQKPGWLASSCHRCWYLQWGSYPKIVERLGLAWVMVLAPPLAGFLTLTVLPLEPSLCFSKICKLDWVLQGFLKLFLAITFCSWEVNVIDHPNRFWLWEGSKIE